MDFQVAAELASFPVVIRLPVQWGDQDAFGHVNNTIYFRWFESSRLEYMIRLGLARSRGDGDTGVILAGIQCNFRRQLKFPDHIQVGASVTRLGNSSLNMAHALYSEALGAVAADGDSTLVTFDYRQQRSCRIPDEIRAGIESLQRDVSRDISKPPRQH
jgi:acyl-CoA thioester hydrolase